MGKTCESMRNWVLIRCLYKNPGMATCLPVTAALTVQSEDRRWQKPLATSLASSTTCLQKRRQWKSRISHLPGLHVCTGTQTTYTQVFIHHTHIWTYTMNKWILIYLLAWVSLLGAAWGTGYQLCSLAHCISKCAKYFKRIKPDDFFLPFLGVLFGFVFKTSFSV